MNIACIGYGALIWKPEPLPLHNPAHWAATGPLLPVEFVRQSQDGRLTLAIVPGLSPCPTYWTLFEHGALERARWELAEREGTERHLENIGVAARNGPTHSRFGGVILNEILEWLNAKDLDAAVWTELPWGWRDATGKIPSDAPVPTLEEALAYLQGLEGETLNRACEYIRNAPPMTRTRYRETIEKSLGSTKKYQ